MWPGLDPIKEVHALVGGFLKSHSNLTLENYVTYISLLYLYKHTCELISCHLNIKDLSGVTDNWDYNEGVNCLYITRWVVYWCIDLFVTSLIKVMSRCSGNLSRKGFVVYQRSIVTIKNFYMSWVYSYILYIAGWTSLFIHPLSFSHIHISTYSHIYPSYKYSYGWIQHWYSGSSMDY